MSDFYFRASAAVLVHHRAEPPGATRPSIAANTITGTAASLLQGTRETYALFTHLATPCPCARRPFARHQISSQAPPFHIHQHGVVGRSNSLGTRRHKFSSLMGSGMLAPPQLCVILEILVSSGLMLSAHQFHSLPLPTRPFP